MFPGKTKFIHQGFDDPPNYLFFSTNALASETKADKKTKTN